MTSNQADTSTGQQLTPPEAPRRCVSCLLLGIVFVSGLLIGSGLTVIFDLDEKAAELFGISRPRKSRSIAKLRDDITDRYADELGLSPEQKSKVREILTEHFSGALERRMKLLDKLSKGLVPILDYAQKAQWEEIKAKRIKKWSEGMPTSRPTTQPGGE